MKRDMKRDIIKMRCEKRYHKKEMWKEIGQGK